MRNGATAFVPCASGNNRLAVRGITMDCLLMRIYPIYWGLRPSRRRELRRSKTRASPRVRPPCARRLRCELWPPPVGIQKQNAALLEECVNNPKKIIDEEEEEEDDEIEEDEEEVNNKNQSQEDVEEIEEVEVEEEEIPKQNNLKKFWSFL